MGEFSVSGKIVDVVKRRIFPGTIVVKDGIISEMYEGACPDRYILPGFIDSHVHIESSLVVPYEFARMATCHGTVATVSDPHEIANVCGAAGIMYMYSNAMHSPFTFSFGVSSCVPATSFETAGATIGPDEVAACFDRCNFRYLSEMMNYPGVINGDPNVWLKINEAKKRKLPIDGHAPGVRGKDIDTYAKAGISTDHECVSLDEALEKLSLGMKILIREGTAAKNYEALHPLINTHTDMCMFCSDDKHCHELARGHINELVVRSIAKGYDLFKVLQVASVNPVRHYGLRVGLLQPNNPADFIVVSDLQKFDVLETYIQGRLVAKAGKTLLAPFPIKPINNFQTVFKKIQDFQVKASGKKLRVISAIDGQLITKEDIVDAKIDKEGNLAIDQDRDILKLIVVNRYTDAPPQVAFVKNFGLQRGALASSVAHDSHNIVAVGTSDEEIMRAVNAVIIERGGLAAVAGRDTAIVPLPVAGLMSDKDGYQVARMYEQLEAFIKVRLEPTLTSPLMTLSFLALLVIPDLKLSDKGLFDVKKFQFVPLSF